MKLIPLSLEGVVLRRVQGGETERGTRAYLFNVSKPQMKPEEEGWGGMAEGKRRFTNN